MALKNKIVSADEAIAIVRDGDTMCVSGFVGIGTPDELILALERRFLKEHQPVNLTLVFAAAPGDGKERGLNRLAHKGLIKRAVGGHWSLVPKLAELALDNEIEAYNLPLGCISHLYREIAARRPGTITKVGLRTFVDPREQGGKLNSVTTEDLVEVLDIGGEEWLRYKSFPINVAFIRGTTCDPNGNITMEREALTLDNLAAAMAAKNSRGFVIAQVERIAAADSLNPREVQVPGILVDCVVLSEANNHVQTYGTPYSHAFSGRQRVPVDRIEPMDLDERKIIARRCAFELPLGGVVNLGIGIPEGVAAVATEERILKYVTLTAEPGIVGGIPQGGLDFGAALNPDAVIQQISSLTFTMAAVSTSPASAWRRRTRTETSTSAASAVGSRAPGDSSISRRTPRNCFSQVRSRQAASRSRSWMATSVSGAKADRRSSSTGSSKSPSAAPMRPRPDNRYFM